MRRVHFDEHNKRIIVGNTMVVEDIELEMSAKVLGIETEEQLRELVKSIGTPLKFRKYAQQKLNEYRRKVSGR